MSAVASPEHAWVRNGRPPSGKGLVLQADMDEAAARGWWAYFDGVRWQMATETDPGAVEDLVRLREWRAGRTDGSDDDWQRWLNQQAAAEREGVHRKEVRATKRFT